MEITTWSHNSRQKCLWSTWTVCFCLCAHVRIKNPSFYEMTFCFATVFMAGWGNVLLCCRDAVNIKGGLEHLVSSIWHPPFTPKRTHSHTHTLMRAMLFDICIGNETSGTGAEYLQQTGRQRGRNCWAREPSGSSRVGSIFNISVSFIPNPALTRRLLTLFSLSSFFFMCLYLFADGWMEGGYFLLLPPFQPVWDLSSAFRHPRTRWRRPPGTRVKNLMVSKVSAAPPFNTGVRVKRLSLFFLGRKGVRVWCAPYSRGWIIERGQRGSRLSVDVARLPSSSLHTKPRLLRRTSVTALALP